MNNTNESKPIRIAIDTSYMDRRPGMGTAVFIRKTVEHLRSHKSELDITLVHRERIPEDPLYKEFSEIVIPQLPVPKGKRPLSELLFFLTTRKRFDVYYFAYANLPWYFFLAPAKHIISIQYDGGPATAGFDVGKSRERIGWALRLFISKVDAFIATSEFGKRGLVMQQKLPEEKIHVLYGGVEPIFKSMPTQDAQAYLQKKYGIAQGPLIIGSGRLDPHKNIHRLVDAFALLKEKYKIPHTLIALGGTHTPGYSEDVLKRIQKHKLEKSFIVLKVDEFADIPYFYNAGEMMVFPSLYEGFGLPAAEAMRCGVPTVLSRAASLVEVGGDATEFVNPESVEDIARGIHKVLTDEVYAKELVAKGYAHVQQFTWENHVEGLVRICRNILK